MKIALWALSFVLLLGASITGIGAGIGALDTEWFAVRCWHVQCCRVGRYDGTIRESTQD